MENNELMAYAKENNLRILELWHEDEERNRTIITGFASNEEVRKCINETKAHICLFDEESKILHEEFRNYFYGERDVNIAQVGVFFFTDEDRPFLREDTCARCIHSTDYDSRLYMSTCTRSGRRGQTERGHYCVKFENRNPPELYYMHGIPVRSKTSLDYRTKSQWQRIGRKVKKGAKGIQMYPMIGAMGTTTYYLIEQTEDLKPRKKTSLNAYSEDPGMSLLHAYDAERNVYRKVLTGFKTFDDIIECKNSVKGFICHFKEINNRKEFLGILELEALGMNLKQVGVCVLPRSERPYLREDSCARCHHCQEYDQHEKTNRCDVSKRHGSILRGHYCENFEHRNGSGLFYRDGVPVRSKTSMDYRTEYQWDSVGRKVKDGEEGLEMYASMNTSKKYVYYLIEQTEECLD